MTHPRRRAQALAPLAALLLTVWLSACSLGPTTDNIISLAAIFPTTGAEGAIGQAALRGAQLAARQSAALGHGYTLALTAVDAAQTDPATTVASLAANRHLMGIIGPLGSTYAVGMLPAIEADGLATISPGAMLPGLTQASLAAAEGLDFSQLHPAAKLNAFFRLMPTDAVLGKAAADLAVAPVAPHGLAAHAVFVVDDGSASGKALAAAFDAELTTQGGSVAGQRSLTAGAPLAAQSVVSAIVEAYPDLVFYAGGPTGGAELRATLSLSGAPGMAILTAGAIADDPAWATGVGMAAAAANTSAILAAADPTSLTSAKRFTAAYQAAYPGEALLPVSALAYDATMDEISAVKALLAAGKPVARAAVLAGVAAAKYQGVTGTLAFDAAGDDTAVPSLSLYTCDMAGAWHYVARVGM